MTRAEAVAAKIRAAIKARQLPRQKPLTLLEDALTAGIITAEDHALVLEAEAARKDAVEVDSFTLEQYLETARSPMAEALIDEDGAARLARPAMDPNHLIEREKELLG